MGPEIRPEIIVFIHFENILSILLEIYYTSKPIFPQDPKCAKKFEIVPFFGEYSFPDLICLRTWHIFKKKNLERIMDLEEIKRIYAIVPPVKYFMYLKKHRNNNITRHPTIDFSFSMHSTEPSLKLRVDDAIHESFFPCGMSRMPGAEYEILDHGERDILVFCYDPQYLPYFQEHKLSPEQPIWHYSADSIIQKTISEILEVSSKIAETGQADQFDLLAISLLAATRSSQKNQVDDQFHRNIIQKIESQMLFNYPDHRSLMEIIENSGLSRRSFFRYWKLYHKETPHEFMRNCVLSDAEQMLKETSLSISEISGRLGFQNPSHFFVMFKKYTGMSPLQFRKTAAKDGGR